MAFAEGTTVPVARTRAEIETLVTKYGATQFSSGWTGKLAAVSFAISGRMVRFSLSLPTEDAARAALIKKPRRGWCRLDHIPMAEVQKWRDAEDRRRWRCLLLAIKAKLEIVKSGIATFDEEFLGRIVMADDMTIYERLKTFEANGQRLLPEVKG